MKRLMLCACVVLATVCATAQAPPRTHKIPTTDTNNVWTGNNDFRGTVTCNGVPCPGGAPAEVNGQDISPKSVKVGSTVQLDSTSTWAQIQSAITAAQTAGGGTVLLPCGTWSGVGLSVGSNVRLQGSGTCTVLRKNANGALVALSGNNPVIQGLYLDGNYNPGGYTGYTVSLINSDGAQILDNTIVNGDRSPSNANAIFGSNCPRTQLRRNTVNTSGRLVVYMEKSFNNSIIEDNTVDADWPIVGGSGGSAISLYAGFAGANADDVKFIKNHVTSNGFCIEIGAFNGPRPQRPILQGNDCTLTGNGFGGYSLPNTDGAIVTNNTYNSGGYYGSVAAVEITQSKYAVVAHNVAHMQCASPSGYPTGVMVDTSSFVSVKANEIYDIPTQGFGVNVQAITTSGDASNNAVEGNVITLGTGAGAVYGVSVRCPGTSATCNHNTVKGNTIIAPSLSSDSNGVVTGDSNTVASVVSNNTVVNIGTPFRNSAPSTKLYMNDATTYNGDSPYNNTGTSAVIDDPTTPAAPMGSLLVNNLSGSTLVRFHEGTAQDGPCMQIEDASGNIMGLWNCTGELSIQNNSPLQTFRKLNASADQKIWQWDATTDGQMALRSISDSFVAADVFRVTRTAGTPTLLQFGAGMQINAASWHGGSATTGSVAGSSSAQIVVTWDNGGFADDTYKASCSVIEATTSGATLRVHHIESQTATTITARVVNDDSSAHTGTVTCTGIR